MFPLHTRVRPRGSMFTHLTSNDARAATYAHARARSRAQAGELEVGAAERSRPGFDN